MGGFTTVVSIVGLGPGRRLPQPSPWRLNRRCSRGINHRNQRSVGRSRTSSTASGVERGLNPRATAVTGAAPWSATDADTDRDWAAADAPTPGPPAAELAATSTVVMAKVNTAAVSPTIAFRRDRPGSGTAELEEVVMGQSLRFDRPSAQ